MVSYNAIEDPLCYPGTHVLRNLANLHDQNELDEFEQLMFDSRAGEELPFGTFDFSHYQALHRHFFQDIYDWAGEIRSIRTGKGSHWFCYPEYIESEAQRVFAKLKASRLLSGCETKDEFTKEAAWFLAEINAIHPFREGNGRIQLVFLTLLARKSGYELDEGKLHPVKFLDAMIESFSGHVEPLTAEIMRMI